MKAVLNLKYVERSIKFGVLQQVALIQQYIIAKYKEELSFNIEVGKNDESRLDVEDASQRLSKRIERYVSPDEVREYIDGAGNIHAEAVIEGFSIGAKLRKYGIGTEELNRLYATLRRAEASDRLIMSMLETHKITSCFTLYVAAKYVGNKTIIEIHKRVMESLLEDVDAPHRIENPIMTSRHLFTFVARLLKFVLMAKNSDGEHDITIGILKKLTEKRCNVTD